MSIRILRGTLLALATGVLALSAQAKSGEAQAYWQPQEIRYSYMAFTTAYDCDAAETKLKRILEALGAHPNTKVDATGCTLNRPTRNFFLTVTTAFPTVVNNAADKPEVDPALAARLGLQGEAATQPFVAQWQTIDLDRQRRLDLEPGDCELMEGLRDHVLSKTPLKIVEDNISCTPKQLSIRRPTLKVNALIAASADD